MRVLLFAFFLTLSTLSFSQVSDEECDVVKSAIRLHEKGEDGAVSFYVIRDGIWFYEFTDNGKSYIKSRMEWLPDCTYQLTMVETNIPNFDLSAGTSLKVRITAVEKNEVSYEYLPAGVLPEGTLIIE